MRFKKIYVEITNKCNRNCSFCSIDNLEKKEMSIEEFKIVIKKIKDYTNYIYLHVKGEPLLHSNFNSIIEICNENKINVNITTNGYFLKKYYELIIKSSSIRQINISLHAYNIKEMEKVKEIIDTAHNISLNSNIYIQLRYWLYDKKDEKLRQFNQLIKDIYRLDNIQIKNIEELKNVKLNNLTYLNKDKKFNWPNINNNYYSEIGTCYGTRSHIAILSNGNVIPCCLDSNCIINLGNIFKENMKDILNSKKFLKIYNGFLNNKKTENLCRHCDFI